MRENMGLYHGKRVDNGEWVEGYFVAVNSKCYIGQELTENTKSVSCLNGTWYGFDNFYEVIPETVGQYTGLTDKNGKKIWEGDIVKTHYANTKKSDFVETVVFHNGHFCAFHSNNNCKQWAMLYDGVEHLAIDKSVYMDSVEVIGNIHDNGDLLKGGAEE